MASDRYVEHESPRLHAVEVPRGTHQALIDIYRAVPVYAGLLRLKSR